MRRWFLLPLLLFASLAGAAPPAVVDHARDRLEPFAKLEDCHKAERAGWPSGLVRVCTYTITDTNMVDRRNYTAKVWLADPSPTRVAEWAWRACARAQPGNGQCPITLIDEIVSVSSAAHFPVAGFYYEDICDPALPEGHQCEGLHADGYLEAWMFHDGMTSRFAQFKGVNSTRWPPGGGDVTAQSDAIAKADVTQLPSGITRPISLLPSQFRAVSSRKDIPSDVRTPAGAKAWQTIIVQLYVPALQGEESTSENPIVTAYACAKYSDSPRACFAPLEQGSAAAK